MVWTFIPLTYSTTSLSQTEKTTALLTTAPKMPRRAGFQRAQNEQIVDLPLPPSFPES